MTKKKKDTFKCEGCGGEFLKAWTEKEAIQEYHERFPGEPFDMKGLAIVCENCHNKIELRLKEERECLNYKN